MGFLGYILICVLTLLLNTPFESAAMAESINNNNHININNNNNINNNDINNNPQTSAWVPFENSMSRSRAHMAVVFANASFLIAGGCIDITCEHQVNTVDILDPNQQVFTRHLQLPIKLYVPAPSFNRSNSNSNSSIMITSNNNSTRESLGTNNNNTITITNNNNNNNNNTGMLSREDNTSNYIYSNRSKRKENGSGSYVSLGFSGPTALVRVDRRKEEDYLLFVVGPCSYYFPDYQGKPNSTLVQQQYGSIWQLSTDLTSVEEHIHIHDEISNNEKNEETVEENQLRANATCTTREDLIIIVGGVNIVTGKPLDSIDVYDTRNKRYITNTFRLSSPVRNPLVTVDSELIYIAGGETSGCVSQNLNGETLNINSDSARCPPNTPYTLNGNGNEMEGEIHNYWYPSPTVHTIILDSTIYREGKNEKNNSNNNKVDQTSNDTVVFPSFRFVGELPANPELLVPSGYYNDSYSLRNVSVFDNRYLFVFDGKLCLILNSSYTNCLDVDRYLNNKNKNINACMNHDSTNTSHNHTVCTNNSNTNNSNSNNSNSNNLRGISEWQAVSCSPIPTPVHSQTFFAFTLPAGVLGAMLTLFAVGGFNREGVGSAVVFYRTSGLLTTSVPSMEGLVYIIDENDNHINNNNTSMSMSSDMGKSTLLTLPLQPPRNAYVRLSGNPVCVGTVANTEDVYVDHQPGKAAVAVFKPTIPAAHVYVCVARMPVQLPWSRENTNKDTRLLFTSVTFTPFRIAYAEHPAPVDNGTGKDNFHVVLISISAVLTVSLSVLAVMSVRMRHSAAGGDDNDYDLTTCLLASGNAETALQVCAGSIDIVNNKNNNINNNNNGNSNSNSVMFRNEAPQSSVVGKMDKRVPSPSASITINTINGNNTTVVIPVHKNRKSERDYLVKNTTEGSRYEVIRCIGEGAFSSVYLARRKSDGKEFALKYLICKDDKERLNAIQECETINSVQGHPCIIRLLDMFMNYEFGGEKHITTEGESYLDTTQLALPPSRWTGTTTTGIQRRQVRPPFPEMTTTKVVQEQQLHLQSLHLQQQLQLQQQQQQLQLQIQLQIQQQQQQQQSQQLKRVISPHILPFTPENAMSLSAGKTSTFQSPGENPLLSEGVSRKQESEKRNVLILEPERQSIPQVVVVGNPIPITNTQKEDNENRNGDNTVGETQPPQKLKSNNNNNYDNNTPNPIIVPANSNSVSNATSTVVAPLLPKGKTIHYLNFADPSQLPATRDPPPIREVSAIQTGRTSYAPRGVIHYNNFDITSSSVGGIIPFAPIAQRNNTIKAPNPSTLTTYAPLRYVQTTVSNMQYPNFIPASSSVGVKINEMEKPMIKPKSVAEAVRAAHAVKRNEEKEVVVGTLPISPPNEKESEIVRNNMKQSPAIVPAVNPTGIRYNNEIPSPQKQTQQQQQQQKEGEEPCDESKNNTVMKPVGTKLAETTTKRVPVGVIHEIIKSPMIGTSDSGLIHTRYFCLVMDYHPMGDLCRYVLQHSAKHNDELNRQLKEEEEKTRLGKLLEENSKKGDEDSTGWVRIVPDNSNSNSSLSIFRPGKSSRNCSHSARCPSSLDRANFTSTQAVIGTQSCSNDDISTGSGNCCCSCSGAGNNGSINGSHTEIDFVMRANAFTEEQLLSIAYQLASVLERLHSQQPPIVHRDLKPENILISRVLLNDSHTQAGSKNNDDDAINGNDNRHTEDINAPVAIPIAPTAADGSTSNNNNNINNNNNNNNNNTTSTPQHKKERRPTRHTTGCPVKLTQAYIPIVVTDFGLALVQEDRRRAGRGGGTRPYIAPECWDGHTSTASDVWSLGCVLYALATARVTAQTVRIMSEEATRSGFAAMVLGDILANNYSLAFASFVVSLLVVDPSKRPTAAMASQCFISKDGVVCFDPNCPFFSNVLDL